jgi:hypothetical protein
MTSAIDALRSSPLATELTPAEANVLGTLVVLRALKDGEVLLPEGARDGLLHVVVSGRINVSKDGPDGRTLLHTVEPRGRPKCWSSIDAISRRLWTANRASSTRSCAP